MGHGHFRTYLKSAIMRLNHLLRVPALSKQDCNMLQILTGTLTAHNISQYNNLVVTKDGRADPQRWREVRKRGHVRIYSRRHSPSAQSSETTQLLLLGTIEGKLEDVMYGAVTTTDEDMKIQSAYLKDSVRDSKVLYNIVHPSFHDPFRSVALKWRLYEECDYVSLDTTGMTKLCGYERIGYSISHSVALPEIPSFEKTHNIERGNMSVCTLYRQKTPSTVECYVRGFFDLKAKKEVLKNISIQTIATQWSAFTRMSTFALAKKLSWKVCKDSDWNSQFSRTNWLADNLYDSIVLTHRRRPATANICGICHQTSAFIMCIRRTCTSCKLPVCSKCVDKRKVIVLTPNQNTALEKKRLFCSSCMTAVERYDVMLIVREELVSKLKYEIGEENDDMYSARTSSSTANFSFYSSIES